MVVLNEMGVVDLVADLHLYRLLDLQQYMMQFVFTLHQEKENEQNKRLFL
jgi:hypothetical protein